MKRNFNEDIDEKITQFLMDETENISISQNSFYKIKSGILREKEKGFLNMKFGFLKAKTVIASGLICMATVGTVGVAASSGLSWISTSDKRDEIRQFPTESVVENKVGFEPKYVESFSNGFKFDSLNFIKEDLKNNADIAVSGDQKSITSAKAAAFRYKRDGSTENQYLNLDARKIEEKYADSHEFSDNPVEYNGIKIYYHANKYKAVPEGYKVTEEEQKMIDEGSLQIGYGDPSDKIEEDNNQTVSWYENGIEYMIMNSNYDDLTKDKMIDMAKEVIDK